jgi:hypothetical protein
MTAIWHNNGSGWRLLAPSGFPAEATLHDLVEEAPQMLPLSGAPRIVVVGREVLLGANYADLIAVEPSGRLVVIEIKLLRNAEARRAVVAQILTYAAHLRGMELALLEHDVLGSHLRERGHERLADAVIKSDQEGLFDENSFREGLDQSLAHGHFRLVVVLDDAPAELVRLVGYLESVTDGLLIDLVTVASFDVAGSTVIVPQRVDPEQPLSRLATSDSKPTLKAQAYSVEGADDFIAAIEGAPADSRDDLRRLASWAGN